MAGSDFIPIDITPGVMPSTDNTPQATSHYVMTDKIRFVNGFPEKIGGWDTLDLEYNTPLIGCFRSIFSFTLGNLARYILASNTSLYSVIGQQQQNITPVTTTPETLTNPFATYYDTLASNPLTTTIGTGDITVADTAHKNKVGDTVKLSGAATVNGITDTLINTNQVVTSISTNAWTFSVNGTASASGAGGGAAVVRATKIITVTDAANGFSEGWNIDISGATEAGNVIGGIPIAEVNTHHQIRNVAAGSYDIYVSSFATSSVSGKGNSVDVYPQIDEGLCSSTIGQGYGLGRYGVGRYGVSKMASTPTPARIWSFDRFGNLVVMTPGDQQGVYSWDGNTSGLPEMVTNAPTAVNYVFVSDNIVVTLGAAGVGNRIKWSDQGDEETWTSTAQNQAGEDDIEGADTFLSHASLRGYNLIFTATKVYTFRYINKPLIWETKLLDGAHGLIARNARVVVGGKAYWMGIDNFYMHGGGNVEVIPSNSDKETTIKNYVYNNLSSSQQEKCFAWFNEKFNEIWFHYPSMEATECDRVARYNVLDQTWCPDTMQRNAAEYPTTLQSLPYLIDDEANILRHENGYNDNGAALEWSISSPYFNSGTFKGIIDSLIPDNIQTAGSISIVVNSKNYPNSTPESTDAFPVTTSTEKIVFRDQGRYFQYVLSGSALNQFWRAGAWMVGIKQGSRR